MQNIIYNICIYKSKFSYKKSFSPNKVFENYFDHHTQILVGKLSTNNFEINRETFFFLRLLFLLLLLYIVTLNLLQILYIIIVKNIFVHTFICICVCMLVHHPPSSQNFLYILLDTTIITRYFILYILIHPR